MKTEDIDKTLDITIDVLVNDGIIDEPENRERLKMYFVLAFRSLLYRVEKEKTI